MTQHDFNIILEKYINGICTAEEEKIIFDWCNQNAFTDDTILTGNERLMTQKRIWNKLKINDLREKKPNLPSINKYVGIAASVIVIFSAVVFLLISKFRNQDISVSKSDIEVKNISNKPQNIVLEDGSKVELQAQSRLSYPEHFGEEKRQVYLSGVAKFDVKRNPDKPFLVITNSLTTEVLGTSFVIKSDEFSKSIEVEVLSGKVSVYENSKKSTNIRNGVVLTPNQKISYNTSSNVLKAGIVEKPNIVEKQIGVETFIFEDTPLPKVLEIFRGLYQIDFFIENNDLSRCVFTADLNELPMFTQLDLVCKSINAQYEVRGTNIFITGEGCQAK